MKAKQHRDFIPSSPETFTGSLLDSHKLTAIALRLVSECANELRLPANQRYKLAGLRCALNHLAELGELVSR